MSVELDSTVPGIIKTDEDLISGDGTSSTAVVGTSVYEGDTGYQTSREEDFAEEDPYSPSYKPDE